MPTARTQGSDKRKVTIQTFEGALDNIERMLIQTELTVIAGDHESYKISASIDSTREKLMVKSQVFQGK